MAGILIPCPKCGSGLNLKDGSKLGKLGKCPKCAHRFVLQEPEEVELELAADVAPVGQAAQWVPDDAPVAPAFPVLDPTAASSQFAGVATAPAVDAPAAPAVPQIEKGMKIAEVTGLLGKPLKRKIVATPPQVTGAAAITASKWEYLLFKHKAGFYKLIMADGVVADIHSQPDPQTAAANPATAAKPAAATPAAASAALGTARSVIPQPSRRSKLQRNVGIAIGGVLAAIAMGVVIYFNNQPPPKQVKEVVQKAPERNESYETQKQELKDTYTAVNEETQQMFGTSGQPVTLMMVPTGANIIIHLKPAELWSDQPRFQEMRAASSSLLAWVEPKLNELVRFPLADIEEATLCITLVGKDMPPQVSAIVRMKNECKKSEFLDKFVASRNEAFGTPAALDGVYSNDDTAFVILKDRKTFSIGPVQWLEEMIQSVPYGNSTASSQSAAPGIEEVLPLTDRDRQLTVVFNPGELRIYQKELFEESLHPFVNELADWFDVDTETVVWSMHLKDQKFLSQFLLRNAGEWSAQRLERDIERRLEQLPKEMYELVQYMEPEAMGPKMLIGRFPAMMKVFALGTYGALGDRVAQFTTVLSERAAPNLLAASLLTWDESTRTDFNKAAPPTNNPQLPATIAGRLQLKMEVDFRRRPLQEAFADIGEATKVTFEIDGDALKLAGYTKNMAQTFNLGVVPANDAIKKILSQYDKMCVCLTDEAKKTVTVMTLEVAKAKGLTPMVFK